MKDYVCQKHGPYQGEPVMWKEKLVCEFPCPGCVQDEADDETERKIRESLKRDAEEERIFFISANIEPAYYGVSLATFETETQEQSTNKAKTRDLIEGKIKKLVMTGKNGTGKTHLAVSAIKAIGGKIMTMYEVSTTIRASYTAKAEKTELEIVDALARLPLFVIDELGRTKGGEADQNWLSYILDKRHVRGLPTIIITNKHVKKSCEAEGCPDCLENYITEDVMSRLSENGVMARFTGEDWRKKR